MSKKAMSALLSATILLGGLGAGTVYAASTTENGTAKSTADVSFEEDKTPTKPGDKDPGDPDNPGTGMNGPLSLDYVPYLHFGKHPVPTVTTTYNVLNTNPYIQVTDKTGAMKGWNVTVSTKGFFSGTDELKGAQLTFNAPTSIKALGENGSTAPTGSAVTVGTAGQSIFSAAANTGAGTWMEYWTGAEPDGQNGKNSAITLKVIGGSAKAAAYTADLDWTIASGPNGQ